MRLIQFVLMFAVMFGTVVIYASLLFPVDQSSAFCFYGRRWVKSIGR